MVALAASQNVLDAVQVPNVTADEAYTLMRTELDRFIALGRITGSRRLGQADRLHRMGRARHPRPSGRRVCQRHRLPTNVPPIHRHAEKGQLPEDAINALQLRERSGKSPAELIAELRQVGPIAIRKWAYQFRLIKPIVTSHPVGGRIALRHLMWVVHSRDTWMHRLDICRATDRKFQQTREHDGRIYALEMRDEDIHLRKKLDGGSRL